MIASLSDSKSPHVSKTLLTILTDLNNAIVWMVSTHPVDFKSSNQSFGDFTKSTNYNWYNRHFHIPQFVFFSILLQGTYLSFYFLLICIRLSFCRMLDESSG